MNPARKWSAPGCLILLGSVTLAAPETRAGVVPGEVRFHTEGGLIDAQTGGNRFVSFRGNEPGNVAPGSPFRLGSFVVAAPVDGGTQLVQSSFYISTMLDQFGDHPIDASQPSLENRFYIMGRIEGTIGGPNPSLSLHYFNDKDGSGLGDGGDPFSGPAQSRGYAALQLGDLLSTLRVGQVDLELMTSTTETSETEILARLDVRSVPEPTALSLGMISLLAFVVRRSRNRLATGA